MDHLVLGKTTQYKAYYEPKLLQAVPRKLSRESINLPKVLPFEGTDTWNAYEVSWLNSVGKPIVAILQCDVPIDSENLIESKSFKLYLNSFNQTKFDSVEQVLMCLQKDLSACAGKNVRLTLIQSKDFAKQQISDLPVTTNTTHILLDDLDVSIDSYDLSPAQLLLAEQHNNSDKHVNETLVSHLLKSNCLITNQPDWGSVLIKYQGPRINHANLLKYIISFRQHNEFHEQCVERIFYDILQQCKPNKLTVYARYTRRGGLDINPFRSNFEQAYANVRLARQ